MKNCFFFWNLGVMLYMFVIWEDIVDVVLYGKILGLCFLVICFEDVVSEVDIFVVFKNLEYLLYEFSNSMSSLGKNDWFLVFICFWYVEMGRWLKVYYDFFVVDGFVLFKFIFSLLVEWWDIMVGIYLCMMLMLEIEDVFDVVQMCELVICLEEYFCYDCIIVF